MSGETGPDRPLRGLKYYLVRHASHGWLAVGYMTAPALRANVHRDPHHPWRDGVGP